jgi:hypothetical protein
MSLAPSSLPATLPGTLPGALVETILGRLALLFLTGAAGDLSAARHAATQMMFAYQPQTEDELRLAANIVSFSLHALEALGQASHPDLPLTKILRLRGSAVSLSRESHKAQRRLDQLQNARRAGSQPPAAPQQPASPQIDKALAFIEATRQAMQCAEKPPAKTWTQQYSQRQAAQRIAENLRKNRAAHAAPVA